MTAIEFENISKQYRLGLVSTRTLSHDLNRWWTMNILRKEDPYLKIGEVNDRSHKGKSEYVWALRDINFKVEQGDVVGIIGKNGAGKSTLLKILSKVTSPTTGTIKTRGRIGSLLEVGIGFHPEMTGRENIYMNGAILGMTKQEINRKLDEIIDFSGCERYIDTPTKRYSSGMMVRLGFSVAAHLEPEILVVDEVLAVGDAEFQKKAIGKMQDVSRGEGRTVLFVSHNMASIRALCKRGIILEKGIIKYQGEVNNIVDMYLRDNQIEIGDVSEVYSFNRLIKVTGNFEILSLIRCSPYFLDSNNEIVYKVKIRNNSLQKKFQVTTLIDDIFDKGRAGMVSTEEISWTTNEKELELEITINNHHLSKGKYTLDVWIHTGNVHSIFSIHDAVYQTLTFEVETFNGISINDWKSYWGKIYYQADVKVL